MVWPFGLQHGLCEDYNATGVTIGLQHGLWCEGYNITGVTIWTAARLVVWGLQLQCHNCVLKRQPSTSYGVCGVNLHCITWFNFSELRLQNSAAHGMYRPRLQNFRCQKRQHRCQDQCYKTWDVRNETTGVRTNAAKFAMSELRLQ